MDQSTVGAEVRPERVYGMGLDLDRPDSLTTEERAAFDARFTAFLGRPHRGLGFWLDEGRPGVLKRTRALVERMRVTDGPPPFLPNSVAFIVSYALLGYTEGVRYTVHGVQRQGLTRSQVLELLALAFTYVGPRGAETIAEAVALHEWIEPPDPARLPPGWGPDPDAFRSGLDFSTPELSSAELGRLREWYLEHEGEIPRHVEFLAHHRPDLLKASRNRFEHTILELPKQVVPFAMIQINTGRGFGPGVREGVLLGRRWGVTKEQAVEAMCWSLEYGGDAELSIAAAAVDDVLDTWD